MKRKIAAGVGDSPVEGRHKKVRVQETSGVDSAPTPSRSTLDSRHEKSPVKHSSKHKLEHDQAPVKPSNKTAPKEKNNPTKSLDKNTSSADAQVLKKGRRGHKKSRRERKEFETQTGHRYGLRQKFLPKWHVSEPVGGQMLDMDPIMSQDEEHMLIAYALHVGVYSTSTSLLVRRLSSELPGLITGLALDSKHQTYLYITRKTGCIEKWDWQNGQEIGNWRLSSEISGAATSSTSTEQDLLYTSDRQEGGQWVLTVHLLSNGVEQGSSGLRTLYTQDEEISGFRVLAGGQCIVATSGNSLILGHTKSPTPADLSKLHYTWRVLDCPAWITTFDVRIERSKKPGSLPSVKVAIGDLKGSIYVYDQLLADVLQGGHKGFEVHSRHLHWHRSAVLSLKWSLDGNNLISGGQETVLVIWQLQHGQKEFLPHLSAPIESIVISPSGSSYAVRLPDNSAMILSALERKPTSFHIAGIDVANAANSRHFPFLPTVDQPHKPRGSHTNVRFNACIASHEDDVIYLAVPSSRTSSTSQGARNASCLQSCSLANGQQVSRQALTRNNITNHNFGPESNTIEDPNVTHVLTSHDSQWLANVEEWSPPAHDLESGAYDDEEIADKMRSRRETYLKFWTWNSKQRVWALTSRIDSPHASDLGDSNEARVLDLATSPCSNTFVTLADDGTAKFWHPVQRKRNGAAVRDKDGSVLMNWKCKFSVSLGIPSDRSSSGKLAFSSDGSLVAAAIGRSGEDSIYLLDASVGDICNIQTNLSTGPVVGLGLVGKYLLVLSQRLVIKDLVTLTMPLDLELNLPSSSSYTNGKYPSAKSNGTIPHLAVSHKYSTFAICVPVKTDTDKTRSHFAAFDATTLQALFVSRVISPVNAIFSACARRAWYLLTTSGELITITPPPAIGSAIYEKPPPTSIVAEGQASVRSSTDIFGKGQLVKVGDSVSSGKAQQPKSAVSTLPHEALDSRYVSREQLAEIFDTGKDGSALALPPIQDLFEQVATLYNGRREGES